MTRTLEALVGSSTAPAHFVRGGKTIDQYTVEVFPSTVVDLTDRDMITAEALASLASRPGGALIGHDYVTIEDFADELSSARAVIFASEPPA